MNEERFTDKADIYKKFRPAYPKALIDYLYSRIGFDQNSQIADMGSGTGIFSRLLLERGSRVYCIEPNGDMRKTAEGDLSGYENFVSVGAPAENTGLRDKSLDFVTAAQAFHWFDRPSFKLECRRILKPGGKVALIWNERDYKSEIVKKDYEIRKKYAVDTKGLGLGGGAGHDYLDFFADGVCECEKFPNDLHFDKEGFIGRNLSASYAPRKETDPGRYNGLICELSELFDAHSANGILNYPHFTQSFTGCV